GRLGLDGRGLLATPRALAPRDRIPGRPRVTAGGRVLGGPSRRLRAEGLAGVAGAALTRPSARLTASLRPRRTPPRGPVAPLPVLAASARRAARPPPARPATGPGSGAGGPRRRFASRAAPARPRPTRGS